MRPPPNTLLAVWLLVASAPAVVARSPEVPEAAAARPTAATTDYDEIPGLDLSRLSPAQKALALRVMNQEPCNCGCGFTVAGCRHKDQRCPVSPGLAQGVVSDLLAGKAEADVRQALRPKPTPAPPPPLEATVHSFDNRAAPFKGAADAPVTITVFSDFQCPFCALATPWLMQILEAYPRQVKLVFRNFPLPFHAHADLAAQAGLAAHEQGKFWELHDKMFANVRRVNPESIHLWAVEVGLEPGRFRQAIESGRLRKTIEKDRLEGTAAGVQGTPSFYINGRRYNGGRDLASVRKFIDQELKAAAGKATTPGSPETTGGR